MADTTTSASGSKPNPLIQNTVNNNYVSNRGTKIVQPGSDMNKNSFLKILAAELSNQDPDNTKDSSQFVTQMAQFASIEQVSNLNTTMSNFANNSLVGKNVTLNVADANGKAYTGIIKAVTPQSGGNKISVEVTENGKTDLKDFALSDITKVSEAPDQTLNSINNMSNNNSFLNASALLGNLVELSDKDSSGNFIQGHIVGVYKSANGQVNVKIQKKDTEELLDVSFDKVNKVGDLDKMKTPPVSNSQTTQA